MINYGRWVDSMDRRIRGGMCDQLLHILFSNNNHVIGRNYGCLY